jgi:sporulation-control protein
MAKFNPDEAKVDLVFNQKNYTLGDTVNGKLIIQGGSIKQQINQVIVDFMVDLEVNYKLYSKKLYTLSINETFYIQPTEKKELPFAFDIPRHFFITGYNIAFYFVTHFDIAGTTYQVDENPFVIHPPKPLQLILNSFYQLGFQEKHDSRSIQGEIQTFTFFPAENYMHQIKILTFTFLYKPLGIQLWIELEPSSSGHRLLKEVWLENKILQDQTQLMLTLQKILMEMMLNPSLYLDTISLEQYFLSDGGKSDSDFRELEERLTGS